MNCNRKFSINQIRIIPIGESKLQPVAPKAVENEHSFPWRRMVYKLDLSSIYPEKPRDMDFNATVVKIKVNQISKSFFNLFQIKFRGFSTMFGLILVKFSADQFLIVQDFD